MTEPMLHTAYKPAGLPVFPPHDDPGGDCVWARLVAAAPERLAMDWPDGFSAGIAHRLDIGTSGAVAVADSPEQLEALRRAFARKELVKTYRFVTHRQVPWSENRCELSIGHARRKKRRMVVQRGPDTPHRGKWLDASTDFVRLGPHLWQATMRTGVMHQIRVHAAFVGLPLAGDPLYGGGPTPPGGRPFCLHHVGFRGAGWATDPVQEAAWATID